MMSSSSDDSPWTAWDTYPLVGTAGRLDVAFAQHVGGDEVGIVIAGAAGTEQRVALATLLDVFACYEVKDSET